MLLTQTTVSFKSLTRLTAQLCMTLFFTQWVCSGRSCLHLVSTPFIVAYTTFHTLSDFAWGFIYWWVLVLISMLYTHCQKASYIKWWCEKCTVRNYGKSSELRVTKTLTLSSPLKTPRPTSPCLWLSHKLDQDQNLKQKGDHFSF